MSQPNNQKQSTKNIILSYLSYLALFIGTAFISGGIVHSGNISQIPKYIGIGIAGVSLFLAGSFVQEFVLNRKNLKEEGYIKFFTFSLLLSIGIGMISGGVQHFSDFPAYSSYLIPIGLILSLIAYLLKNNYHINKKLWTVIVATFILVSIPLYFVLSTYANTLIKQTDNACKVTFFEVKAYASEGHSESNCDSAKKPSTSESSKMTDDKMMKGMDHMSMDVKDDQSFIEGMIPHHQEAIDSSNKLLLTTTDKELKAFAQGVITAQSKEINEMKTWYKTWFNKEYTPNSSYMAMMGGMNGKTGAELDKEYVKGMIAHHNGAIEMAKKIQPITKRPEITKLVNDIILSQTGEVKTLEKRLEQVTPHDESGTDAH